MIRLDHITFEYPDHQTAGRILYDIDLEIHEGESIALMGPNGSGKTTLARCLNGLLCPVQGHVIVDGMKTDDASNMLEIRRRVGMVFQNPDNQIVSTTVEREIAFGLENIGVPYEDMHAVVAEMLAKFHLLKYRRHSPHYLSGGEKQRLAVAAVMAMRPRYLVLDEPTSLLDPKSRRDILHIIQQLHNEKRDSPISTIFITQFPEEALIAQRLIILHQGRVFMDDKPPAIFRKTAKLKSIGLEPPVVFYLRHILRRMKY